MTTLVLDRATTPASPVRSLDSRVMTDTTPNHAPPSQADELTERRRLFKSRRCPSWTSYMAPPCA